MTTKYYLWMKENGGCDYTVGCGEKLSALDASTLPEAKKEAIEVLEEHGLFGSEHNAEHVVIYQFVENFTHVYNAELKQRQSVSAEDRKKEKIAEIEQELKRLKGG